MGYTSRSAAFPAIVTTLMLGTAPAFAADLGVNSKIDAVSLYPDGATVTRIIAFDAPSGETTLVASDFPVGLDPASVRVDAHDGDGIAISGIDLKTTLVDPPQPDEQRDRTLRDLQDKRDAIDGAGKALLAKQALMGRFANTASFDATKEGSDIARVRNAWNAIGDDMAEVNEALRVNALKLRDVDEAIARLQTERDGRPEGKQRTQFRLSLTSDRPAKGSIAVSYLTGSANWTPLYDARLASTGNALEITRRAQIRQQTGEDWTDAALTVSTAHATTGASPPRLTTTALNFIAPPEPLAAASPPAPAPMEDSVAPRRAASETALGGAQVLDKIAVPGREVSAALDTGGFQSVWVLTTRVTIPSANSVKAVRLGSFTASPQIVARTAPALQPTAYLEAAFVNDDGSPLYPGTVSIYRDGLYVGQAQMPLATKGEPVRLGFGADDRIKVERVVTRKLESETGYRNPLSSDRRSYKIILRNGRPTPITVSVEEAIPVSESKDIKVDLAPKMTPPTTKDADNRRGVTVWTVDLAPGATKDIDFGYKVTWPAGEPINLD